MTDPDEESSEAKQRAKRLEKIRKAIEAGEYDTEEMMDKALRKFLQRSDDETPD